MLLHQVQRLKQCILAEYKGYNCFPPRFRMKECVFVQDEELYHVYSPSRGKKENGFLLTIARKKLCI